MTEAARTTAVRSPRPRYISFRAASNVPPFHSSQFVGTHCYRRVPLAPPEHPTNESYPRKWKCPVGLIQYTWNGKGFSSAVRITHGMTPRSIPRRPKSLDHVTVTKEERKYVRITLLLNKEGSRVATPFRFKAPLDHGPYQRCTPPFTGPPRVRR
ncbi:hypothetical protein BDW22DRAFT_1111308 [Trametopsis cervina]|nr:hypothetical protein BDW22DRAFT_1111308 [Trametopsis cervina]